MNHQYLYYLGIWSLLQVTTITSFTFLVKEREVTTYRETGTSTIHLYINTSLDMDEMEIEASKFRQINVTTVENIELAEESKLIKLKQQQTKLRLLKIKASYTKIRTFSGTGVKPMHKGCKIDAKPLSQKVVDILVQKIIKGTDLTKKTLKSIPQVKKLILEIDDLEEYLESFDDVLESTLTLLTSLKVNNKDY